MSSITARVPIVDWNKGFHKHWNGGDVSATHAFDVLSFMFPQGEKFFIKVAKEVSQQNKALLTQSLKEDLQEFILQEAMHTGYHESYNQILQQHGYKNGAYNFIEYLDRMAKKYLAPIHKLAIVCAWEHYTAILGGYLLKNPMVLNNAPLQMRLIWHWHAAEETEHKAVCFDLYKQVGGSWLMRVSAFLQVSINFILIFSCLYCSMLWRDGSFRVKRLPKTLYQSARFFWGRKGVGWYVLVHGLKYLSPHFHPWQQNNKDLLQAWLAENDHHLKKVLKRNEP
jgi:predicted metal-dependent hydrolase